MRNSECGMNGSRFVTCASRPAPQGRFTNRPPIRAGVRPRAVGEGLAPPADPCQRTFPRRRGDSRIARRCAPTHHPAPVAPSIARRNPHGTPRKGVADQWSSLRGIRARAPSRAAVGATFGRPQCADKGKRCHLERAKRVERSYPSSSPSFSGLEDPSTPAQAPSLRMTEKGACACRPPDESVGPRGLFSLFLIIPDFY